MDRRRRVYILRKSGKSGVYITQRKNKKFENYRTAEPGRPLKATKETHHWKKLPYDVLVINGNIYS